MADLTIPEKYATWMRIAALRELEDDARGLGDEAKRTVKTIREDEFYARHDIREEPSLDRQLVDVLGTVRRMRDTADVVAQILSGELTIAGELEAVAYMLDSLTRHVVAEELADAGGPLEDNSMTPLVDALAWASAEMARLRVEQEGAES